MKTAFFDWDNWREIGVTLLRNKTRTFLTAFGIFWGTAMLAMLLGGSQGLKDIISRNFEGFATNSALIFSGRTTMSYRGFNKGTSWEIRQDDVDMLRKAIPEIDALTCVKNFTMSVVNGKNVTSVSIQGQDDEFTRVFEPVLYSGRLLNRSDNVGERKVCVLGKKVANDLFGMESPLGKFVSIGGIYYRVVGVAGQTSEINIGARVDESVMIPQTTMNRSYNVGKDLGAMMFTVDNGISPTSLLPRIERVFRMHHPISPDDHNAMFFMDVSEQFKMVDNLFLGIKILALFVGFGTLFAGIIGVGNIMWVIVKERTKEIGIRRAIGARPADIITQVLSEGVALTIIAGTAGISFATLVLYMAQQLTANEVSVPHFQLSFMSAVSIMIIFVILGTLAGLIPSVKAMKIKPIEALNDK